jgi:galactose mutarotase-like enzyme
MQKKNIIYRGRNAVSISSGIIEAVFFTDFGAKLVSLRNKENDYEYLWQGKNSVHPLPNYGSLYVNNDLCGADDIFPSINPSFYPFHPWQGTHCPPHGELWSIPWQLKSRDNSLVFSVYGVRFPYYFERKVSFVTENMIHFSYVLKNLSDFDLFGVWAFHPLFNAGKDSRIVLPPGNWTVESTLDYKSVLGGVGAVHTWPGNKEDLLNEKNQLDRFYPDTQICEKFYVREILSKGEVELIRDGKGRSLRFVFDPALIPYLGIWKNQGGLLGQNNIAIEPAIGSLDDLYVSSTRDKTAVIPGQGEALFHFSIEFQ